MWLLAALESGADTKSVPSRGSTGSSAPAVTPCGALGQGQVASVGGDVSYSLWISELCWFCLSFSAVILLIQYFKCLNQNNVKGFLLG